MNNLNINFTRYTIPTLNEDDEEMLINFIVLIAQQGFTDNIVNGRFLERQ